MFAYILLFLELFVNTNIKKLENFINFLISIFLFVFVLVIVDLIIKSIIPRIVDIIR